MTWQELLQTDYEIVIVQSYGYTERSSFSSHFEPFSHLREFKFEIDNKEGLLHPWLYLEEPESELTFEEKDGKVYCFDPDLWARP
jgi:hypothetical protein